MNRGWRFCRFNGVVNRVVSCWSLVGRLPRFAWCSGRIGLRLDYGAAVWRTPDSAAVRAVYPNNRSAQPKHIVLSVKMHAPAVCEASYPSSFARSRRPQFVNHCGAQRPDRRVPRARRGRRLPPTPPAAACRTAAQDSRHRAAPLRRAWSSQSARHTPAREPAGSADRPGRRVRQIERTAPSAGSERDANPDCAYAVSPPSSTCRITRPPSARDRPARRTRRAARKAPLANNIVRWTSSV